MIIVQIRLGVPFDGEGRRETGERLLNQGSEPRGVGQVNDV